MKKILPLFLVTLFLNADSLELSDTFNSSWSNGAISNAVISGNFKLCSKGSTIGHKIFGVSSSNTSHNYSSIKYALYLPPLANIVLYENGSFKGFFSSYTSSDVLCVVRNSSIITYTKNNIVFYTSTIEDTSDLVVDTSFYGNSTDSSAKLFDIKLNNNDVFFQSSSGVNIISSSQNKIDSLSDELDVSSQTLYVLFGLSGVFLSQFLLIRIS